MAHHCPSCFKFPFSTRCMMKGHVLLCLVHAEIYMPGKACASCHRDEVHAVREEERRRRHEKNVGKNES
ncbi:hypothetical protein F4825DRAFT_424245 [Nemania diffusa]|nr:hypothetical protein F4825DRAFT_424245 [Nemania diffusa]